MKSFLAFAAALLVPALSWSVAAQTLPADGTPVQPTAPTIPARETLVKLGLGINRGSRYGGYNGLVVPLTLGVERQLSKQFSAYANLTAGFQTIQPRNAYSRVPLVQRGIVALGGRYYYNQAGREKHNRASGPFVGNYLALQVSTDLQPVYRYNASDARTRLSYDYSALTVLWGMQRRLGRWFLYDLNAGVGLSNQQSTSFDPLANQFSFHRRATFLPEVNLGLSLVR